MFWNYLRVRGEYKPPMTDMVLMLELPPRARRIRLGKPQNRGWRGTTSACAENTLSDQIMIALAWNYLRVRGEYPQKPYGSGPRWELPPRARRIHGWAHVARVHGGTTSACAENTSAKPKSGLRHRNYLRVRGEYLEHKVKQRGWEELPPRARRIQVFVSSKETPRGTTSACAENTQAGSGTRYTGGNYLRVRGEYIWEINFIDTNGELPPRARRIP